MKRSGRAENLFSNKTEKNSFHLMIAKTELKNLMNKKCS